MPTRDELVTQLQADMNAIGIQIADARMGAIRAEKVAEQAQRAIKDAQDAAERAHAAATDARESVDRFERDKYAEVERLSVQIVALRAVSEPKAKQSEGYVPGDAVAHDTAPEVSNPEAKEPR